MAADLEAKQPKAGGGLRHPKRRVAVRIDMTPMVDVAFLLLIFFMVTTVFREPQAMEMNLPPADAKVQVAKSNVLNVFVDKDEHMFYKMGDGPLTSTSIKDLNALFMDNIKLNPDLIILVKVSRQARYNDMVDIMDELEIANMTRFSLVPMTDDDAKMLEGHQ